MSLVYFNLCVMEWYCYMGKGNTNWVPALMMRTLVCTGSGGILYSGGYTETLLLLAVSMGDYVNEYIM